MTAILQEGLCIKIICNKILKIIYQYVIFWYTIDITS
jgi:hypothetical protein